MRNGFNHPLDILQGLHRAAQILQRADAIHLDLFTRKSIDNLGQLVDLNDPEATLTDREAVSTISSLRSSEGVLVSSKERL